MNRKIEISTYSLIFKGIVMQEVLQTASDFLVKLNNLTRFLNKLSIQNRLFKNTFSKNTDCVNKNVSVGTCKGFFLKNYFSVEVSLLKNREVVSQRQAILTSPHVDKVAQEHFELRRYDVTLYVKVVYSFNESIHAKFFNDFIDYFIKSLSKSFLNAGFFYNTRYSKKVIVK